MALLAFKVTVVVFVLNDLEPLAETEAELSVKNTLILPAGAEPEVILPPETVILPPET